jgi:hypothetical protein
MMGKSYPPAAGGYEVDISYIRQGRIQSET